MFGIEWQGVRLCKCVCERQLGVEMQSAKQNKTNVITMLLQVQSDGKNENNSPGKASQN
jgi:hypothetical protein